MSFIKRPEYEFETTEDAVNYLEKDFGEQQSYDSGGQVIWDAVEVGADVLFNDIEGKTNTD